MKRNDVQRYMTQYAKGSQSCMIPFIVIGKLAKSVEIEDFYFLEIENRLNNKGRWQIVWGEVGFELRSCIHEGCEKTECKT